MQRSLLTPALATITAIGIIGFLSGCTAEYFSIEAQSFDDDPVTGENVQWSEAVESVNTNPTPDTNLAPAGSPADNRATRNEATNPVELGLVAWGRDLEHAKRQSSESGNPVLVLFQEVPG